MKAGERVEISPDSWNIMRGLGELVRGRVDMEPVVVDADIKGNKEVKEHKLPEDKSAGGAGLVMDYGANGFSSNSFRVSVVHGDKTNCTPTHLFNFTGLPETSDRQRLR